MQGRGMGGWQSGRCTNWTGGGRVPDAGKGGSCGGDATTGESLMVYSVSPPLLANVQRPPRPIIATRQASMARPAHSPFLPSRSFLPTLTAADPFRNDRHGDQANSNGALPHPLRGYHRALSFSQSTFPHTHCATCLSSSACTPSSASRTKTTAARRPSRASLHSSHGALLRAPSRRSTICRKSSWESTRTHY